MHPVIAWWLAIRPKTLALAATPVLVGNSFAQAHLSSLNWSLTAATLLAALLIQVGTNLYNDAADHERGTDGPDRLGPPRVTAQGWLRSAQVKHGALLSFAAALLLGIYLSLIAGWPILLLGLLSLIAGYAYTGGPWPIAYSATGEAFVFLFFGVFAVAGSYYLQTQTITIAVLLAGAALGIFAAAVLLVNNYRDLDSDRRAYKRTLCYWLGRAQCRSLYAGLLLFPFLWPLCQPQEGWPVLFILPVALKLIQHFWQEPPGAKLNDILAATARLQLGYGLLLAFGVLLLHRG